VRQVLDGGRSVPQVARSLERSDKTLANWVMARKGQPLLKRSPAQPVDDLQAENARLRQETARLSREYTSNTAVRYGQPSRVEL
jgi:transposase